MKIFAGISSTISECNFIWLIFCALLIILNENTLYVFEDFFRPRKDELFWPFIISVLHFIYEIQRYDFEEILE